ncbi:MAG: response regulator transcription factor [Coriobacteriia bacterium]|nr:response regulator transcription factor [Coriobacteriia bacterium]
MSRTCILTGHGSPSSCLSRARSDRVPATANDAPPRKVLVVDDEAQILRALKAILNQSGYEVGLAATGEEALQIAPSFMPDLVVLDLSLPGISGLEVCRLLREWLKAPILILSVRDTEGDKIAALDLGADDYLTKPFSAGELLARLRALARRIDEGREAGPSSVSSGEIRIDFENKVVTRGGEQLKLTRTEFEILATLASNADRVVTASAIIRRVWGSADPTDTKALRFHVSNLRAKIETDPATPELVVTEPGIGYRFVT